LKTTKLTSRINLLLQQGLVFSIVKSTVLFAPLMAAYFLPKKLYGEIEWTLAISSLLAIGAAVGASGVVAFSLVNLDGRKILVAALVYVICASGFLLLIEAGFYIYGLSSSNITILFLALTSVFICQSALAAFYKASGDGVKASIVESSLSVCLMIYVGLHGAIGLEFEYLVLILNSGSIVLMAILSRVVQIKERVFSSFGLGDLPFFFKRGVPIMLASICSLALVVFPRIVLGFVGGPVDVAEFSLGFRWVSISIIAHQFINTMFFREIYSTATNKFDLNVAFILFLVLGVAIGAVGLVIVLQQIYSLDGLAIPASVVPVLPALIGAMVLWSASANLEGMLYKNQRSDLHIGAVAIGFLFLVSLLLVLLSYFENVVPIVVFVWVGGLAVTVLVQVLGVYKVTGISLPYISITIGFVVVLSVFLSGVFCCENIFS
jgi:hypothetical protein